MRLPLTCEKVLGEPQATISPFKIHHIWLRDAYISMCIVNDGLWSFSIMDTGICANVKIAQSYLLSYFHHNCPLRWCLEGHLFNIRETDSFKKGHKIWEECKIYIKVVILTPVWIVVVRYKLLHLFEENFKNT